MAEKKPEVMVFAGPNGSGKSTVTDAFGPKGVYINADVIKSSVHCTDLEAAQLADKFRYACLERKEDFTFETVLSTQSKIDFLKEAKAQGYFIRSIFVFTRDWRINAARVKMRVALGGHDVPEEKIFSRYNRSIKLLPELIAVSDICNVYDNSGDAPVRIFKKRKDQYYANENNNSWSKNELEILTGVSCDLISQRKMQ